jgi:hypothetical protein
MRTPGIGDYDLVALDGIKHSPVRMPIGKAGIGELLDNKIPSTFPSPASYTPIMPAIKQGHSHRGSTIGQAIRMCPES